MKIETRKKLGDLLKEYTEKNTDNEYKPVAVGRYGIRKREDIYSKELAKDYSKNKLIYKNTLTVGMGSKQIDIGILTDDEIYAVSPAYHTFRINNIDADYLRYCLDARNADMSERFMIASARQGKSVDFKKMLEYEIPVYSVCDTQTILFNLSKVEDIILNLDSQLEKMDLLVKSRFIEMFENDLAGSCMTINDIAKDATVGIANSATHAYCDDGIVMLRNQNIRVNYLDDEDLIYIKPEFAAKYKSKALKKDDILVTRTGANVGMACIVPAKYEGCQTFTTLILRLKENVGILPEFVCHYINSPRGQRFVHENKVGGAQPNFGAKQLATMPIAVPEIKKQEEFVLFTQEVDKSKLAVQKVREKIEKGL